MTAARLSDDFVDSRAEAGVIASIAADRALFWRVADQLPPGAFTAEAGAWATLREAIEADKPFAVPDGAEPAGDITAAIERLADLHRRRQLADVLEGAAQGLADKSKSARDVARLFEEEAGKIAAATRDGQADTITWASDLLPDVLRDADDRVRLRKETGQPVIGVPTRIKRLDEILNGLNEGLIILAAGPGAGKTSLAWQLAQEAARDAVAVFVTFENSPKNLVTKAIARRAGVNPLDIQRGYADVDKLNDAAADWALTAERIVLIEGHGHLTIDDVRARALQAMHQRKASQALVVVDYLQLWAKAATELRGLGTPRERVEVLVSDLRGLAVRLHSPVLVISSQNRQAGNYGNEESKGSAALDSLKESGDIEYASDVVMALTRPDDRHTVPPLRAVDLVVAKNRNGPIGRVEMIFDPVRAVLTEVDGGA